MKFYPVIIVLHIVFAGMWLTGFLLGPLFRSAIKKNRNKPGEKKLISLYLFYLNLLGMVSAIGILLTGISMVALNSGYGFFQFSENHWLVAKQIIMIAILAIIGGQVIPTAKKIRVCLGKDLENSTLLSDEGYRALHKLFMLSTFIDILVLINFLLAVTHNYFG
jgi:hypothetical protein